VLAFCILLRRFLNQNELGLDELLGIQEIMTKNTDSGIQKPGIRKDWEAMKR
jgi:hypothetical protein